MREGEMYDKTEGERKGGKKDWQKGVKHRMSEERMDKTNDTIAVDSSKFQNETSHCMHGCDCSLFSGSCTIL